MRIINRLVFAFSKMATLLIKTYSHAYKKSVVDLILCIQRDEFGIPISLQQQPDLENIPGYYQQGNGNFWVATSGSLLVGTIALLDIGNQQGALRKMFVDRDYRGSETGVGQQLFNHLMAWARAKRMNEIYLGTTEKFKAAQRFYEKNGFVTVRKTDLPVAFPVMEVDVKFYTRRLS